MKETVRDLKLTVSPAYSAMPSILVIVEAAVTHHMGIEREDADVEAQVITKTRNYWFLDGSNTLDGKKNLNSIYRKEYIQ